MGSKYHTVKPGEWRAPRRRGYRVGCCDCGLVHRMNYRLHRNQNGRCQIQVQSFRDNRATAQVRRGMKIGDWTDILHAIKRKVGKRSVPVLITIRKRTRYVEQKRSKAAR